MTLSHKLLHFQGRIRRLDYWLCSLLVGLFALCLAALAVLGFGRDMEDVNLSTGLWLVTLWPNLAIAVKRLHDRDLSGWFCVPFMIIPGLLQEIPARFDISTPVALLVNVSALALLLWGLVEMGFRDTVSGPNRFGPSPKQSSATAAIATGEPTLSTEPPKA